VILYFCIARENNKARTGDEAVRKVRKRIEDKNCCRNYLLILMDINMPIMDGEEATKKIRELETKFENVPRSTIIAQTAAITEKSDIKDTYESRGFDGVVEKPMPRGMFNSIIRKYL